jgi:hypothetical protein
LLADFVNERVLVWGVPDRDAFARYAEQRKLPLTNLNDSKREVVFHLENRCPRDARLLLTSKRGTGQTANWQHSQPAESSTRLDLLAGDRICIDHPSGVCVTVVPENGGVAISEDCSGLVLQGR